MRKLLLVLPALMVALLAVFASTGQSAFAAANIKVQAGGGETGYAVNLFLPAAAYVQPGDTVTWTFPGIEPHTVTFGVPAGDPTAPTSTDGKATWSGTGFISSGFPDSPASTFAVTFPNAGVFDYFCAIHPGMKGAVHVQGPGIGVPDNQASVDARGKADYDSALASLKSLAGQANAIPVAVTANAGGGRTYTLAISSPHDSPVGDVQQFFPAAANIGVGDTVQWVSNVHTPHTISIIPPGIDLNGPPPPELATWDPFETSINLPADGKYKGGFVSTAVMGIDLPGGTKFSLTFPAAGTYTYACVLHADQGMIAKINVGAPGAPNTGDSPAATTPAEGSGGLWLVAGAVAFAFLATGVAFGATRRS